MATTRTILDLVAEAEGEEFRKDPWVYDFRGRKFYEGDGPYANNAMGIGYMAIEGVRGTRFVVVPAFTGEELFAWLRANQ